MKTYLFKKKFLVAGILIILVATASHGDEVRLKSGGLIKGIITEVKAGTVSISVGFGTTLIDSADIRSILYSSSREDNTLRKQWQDRTAGKADPHHPDLQTLIEKLRKLRALRLRAINRQQELERLDSEIDSLEHALSDNASDYQALTPDLDMLSKKDIDEQYRLFGKAHQYNSSIISLQQMIEQKKADQEKGNPAFPEYMDSIALMEEALHAFKRTCGPKVLKNNRAVLSNLESDFKKYKSEFRTAVTDATFIQGDQIIVPVTINGRGPVFLLLDTGASTVTLSRALAARLGINWRDGFKVTATLADGKVTSGHAILLRSVAVGDFRADNVRAVVMDEPPGKGIDGLLGMSYLQRFILRIDPANKKFVLKKIIAQ